MSEEVAGNQLCVLRQRQKTSLQLCEEKIKQWTNFCSEYSALNERLQTITDNTRHSVIIPIVQSNSRRPPIALVSAYLHHTNEILVLLGDNWFVERSAKEASSIVQRRLKECKVAIDKLKEEKKQIESWMSFTNELMEEKSDFVEIIEEFDENEELKWKEKHRQNVKRYNKQQAELRKTNKLGAISTQN
ncbi:unconventional prefoldin RPB5 interactor 1-like protein, partial [Leptotrombidium deliense]